MEFGKNTDDNNDTWTIAAGQAHGEYNHTLTYNEMPKHNHDFTNTGRPLYWDSGLPSYGGLTSGNTVQYTWSANTKSAGEGWSHNNMPPYLGVYMWKRTA